MEAGDASREAAHRLILAALDRAPTSQSESPSPKVMHRSQIDRAESGFPTKYPTRRVDPINRGSTRPRLLMGVSTLNRRRYLERFIQSFETTRSPEFDWTLVVADDGSHDGSLEYLRELVLPECTLIVIENRNRAIAGQTNSILATALLSDPDLCFKADDDVFFLKSGWDHLYWDAVKASGFAHLVYHNSEWKRPHDVQRRGHLRSSVPAIDSMGCFYTFTPEVVEEIGYFDEVNFPIRGHSHVDWSMRACRAGHNESVTIWDADGSEHYIGMWQGKDYEALVDWRSDAVRVLRDPTEKTRRLRLLADDTRVRVEHRSTVPAPEAPRVWIVPPNAHLDALLAAHAVGRPSDPGGTAAYSTVPSG